MQTFVKGKYGQHLKVTEWSEIPIVTYKELEKWIDVSGLTNSTIKHHVETSGSSSRSKKIPYTNALNKSFLSLFKIWVYDLLKNVLKPDIGKIFMSLSPPANSGLKDDTQYLNFLLRWVLKPYLILPPIDHPERYQENLARTLLAERNLGVISIWNPSYLTQTIEYIEENREQFEDLIGKGPVEWGSYWPKLQFISCWTEGWASPQAERLKSYFPDVILQGKGLLATEAPLTVPLHNSSAPVPLIDEVYFEFENSNRDILTLDQVSVGEVYELIISQKSGLIRYRIEDKVRISDHYLDTPCLTFVGRAGRVCDMVGEKLDSIMVEDVLNELIKQPKKSLLLPVFSTSGPCYYLLLTENRDENLATNLDEALQKIYHYHVARLTGQLRQAKVTNIDHLTQKLHQIYLHQGMNWGDIKSSQFIHDPASAAEILTLLAL